uniref:Uncharacterized protein n=1 Tax=Anguilla anguilla TaxID=7936 RepID=A0A0E9TYN7_ANGAN
MFNTARNLFLLIRGTCAHLNSSRGSRLTEI